MKRERLDELIGYSKTQLRVSKWMMIFFIPTTFIMFVVGIILFNNNSDISQLARDISQVTVFFGLIIPFPIMAVMALISYGVGKAVLNKRLCDRADMDIDDEDEFGDENE